jgi:hypothetical protein
MGLGVCGSLCQAWVRPLERSAVHLGNLTGGYNPGESLKRLRSDALLGHLGSDQWRVMISGQKGNHGLWVKCTTSTKLIYQPCSRLWAAKGAPVICGTWSETFWFTGGNRLMVLVMTMVLVSGILSVWKEYIGLITCVNTKTWLSTSK